MTYSSRRTLPCLSLLLSLFLLVGLVATPRAAAAQEQGLQGLQFDATGLWTSFMAGAFPFDETGWGGTAGLHYRWPSGLSFGVVGLHAQPEDLSLPASDVRRTMSQWGALGELRFYLNDLAAVRPYVGARAGWMRLDDENGTTGDGLGYALVVGSEFWASDRFGFRLAASSGGVDVSNDFPADQGVTWTVEAGLSLFLGDVNRVVDTDGDGVEDGEDRCAGTPAGVAVDARGCPPDGDGDDVADHRDECPGTPAGARVDRRGCPTDGDGDGVADGLDQCPGTTEGVEVDDRGCERDTDGDGVPDGPDACPDTEEGREVDASGCTEIEAGIERGRLSLSNIHFAFASARLDAASREILDEVGRALVNRAGIRARIEGHTDSIGSAEANLRMSRARVGAVREYLLVEFPEIGPDQLEAVGIGENAPVADNGTDAGRARNRRVEFVVLDEQGGSGG